MANSRVALWRVGAWRADQETAKGAKPVAAATAAAEPAKVAEKAKKPAKNVELRPCLCGCGAASKARFLPGHDARLHSIVLKIHRCVVGKDELKAKLHEAPATIDYLKTAPWMTSDLARAIDLDR